MLQSNCIGGLLYGWIATPHVTLPCSAVHSCALDVAASAGAAIPSRAQSARSHSRCIHASSQPASTLIELPVRLTLRALPVRPAASS